MPINLEFNIPSRKERQRKEDISKLILDTDAVTSREFANNDEINSAVNELQGFRNRFSSLMKDPQSMQAVLNLLNQSEAQVKSKATLTPDFLTKEADSYISEAKAIQLPTEVVNQFETHKQQLAEGIITPEQFNKLAEPFKVALTSQARGYYPQKGSLVAYNENFGTEIAQKETLAALTNKYAIDLETAKAKLQEGDVKGTQKAVSKYVTEAKDTLLTARNTAINARKDALEELTEVYTAQQETAPLENRIDLEQPINVFGKEMSKITFLATVAANGGSVAKTFNQDYYNYQKQLTDLRNADLPDEEKEKYVDAIKENQNTDSALYMSKLLDPLQQEYDTLYSKLTPSVRELLIRAGQTIKDEVSYNKALAEQYNITFETDKANGFIGNEKSFDEVIEEGYEEALKYMPDLPRAVYDYWKGNEPKQAASREAFSTIDLDTEEGLSDALLYGNEGLDKLGSLLINGRLDGDGEIATLINSGIDLFEQTMNPAKGVENTYKSIFGTQEQKNKVVESREALVDTFINNLIRLPNILANLSSGLYSPRELVASLEDQGYVQEDESPLLQEGLESYLQRMRARKEKLKQGTQDSN